MMSGAFSCFYISRCMTRKALHIPYTHNPNHSKTTSHNVVADVIYTFIETQKTGTPAQ